MPFQYDLILDDSLENRDSRSRGSRARAVSNWVQWAQFERLIRCEVSSSSSTGKSLFRQFDWSRIKHRIKEDPCKAAIAVAVEVRAGFDHVVGT